MKHIIAEVTSSAELMLDTYLIWLRAPEIAAVAQPGQFLMVRCGDDHDPLLRRPLSIHRTAGGEQVALLFNVVGKGTLLLSQYQRGDRLGLLGPLGNGFSLHSGTRRLLLVAGGIGIAPLIFLADEALNQGHVVNLLMGVPKAPLLYPRSLLPSLIDLVIATEDGSEGRKGVVTDLIADRIKQADQVFACGPVSMYESIAGHGFGGDKSVQVSLEVMMGCGLGACYGCTIRTRGGLRQVCHDGPVFELGDILFVEGGDTKW